MKLLGQGGFGAVYKAWDLNLSHSCAVKENLDTTTDAQRQFTREATVLANLSHPNLPRVTDHFVLPGQGQYLVMDFIEGDDLQSILEKDGAVPYEKVLPWINQVLDALDYLHKRTPPVLHRDIKPANIKITPEGKAVLVDFGLVKLYDSHVKTTVGARAITPGYSPPEQYGQGSTDARSDIYAVGATMYALLTGLQPPESVQRVANDTLRPVHVVNPRVPMLIGNAVSQAMALSPDNRFRAIDQFRATLSGAPVASVRPERIPPETTQKYGMPATVSVPISKPLKKKLPAWVIVLGAVVSLGVLGGLCALVFSIPSLMPSFATNTPAKVSKASTATAKSPTEEFVVQASPTTFITRTPVRVASPTYLPGSGVALLGGPYEGSIVHNATDGLIGVMNTELKVADFIAKVDFINPYGTSIGTWDFGILFREQGFNNQYRLVVLSNKSWKVTAHDGSADGVTIASGELTNLNITDAGTNSVLLVVFKERGWFFLNGQLISELDLSTKMLSGGLELGVGLYANDEIDGYSTQYKNFEIWQANLTPQSGSLIHDEDTFIEEFGGEEDISNFILTVTYTNPYSTETGNYDYGFMFRNAGGNEQYRLTIAQNKEWKLTNHTGSADGVSVGSGTISTLKTNAGEQNSFTLIAIDTKGWLYCNNILVSAFDLSKRLTPGSTHIASGMYTGDEIPGYSTDFSDFVVLPLP